MVTPSLHRNDMGFCKYSTTNTAEACMWSTCHQLSSHQLKYYFYFYCYCDLIYIILELINLSLLFKLYSKREESSKKESIIKWHPSVVSVWATDAVFVAVAAKLEPSVWIADLRKTVCVKTCCSQLVLWLDRPLFNETGHYSMSLQAADSQGMCLIVKGCVRWGVSQSYQLVLAKAETTPWVALTKLWANSSNELCMGSAGWKACIMLSIMPMLRPHTGDVTFSCSLWKNWQGVCQGTNLTV